MGENMRQYRVAPKLSAVVVLAQFAFFLASWWLIAHHTKQTVATILETQSKDAMNRILDTVPAAIINDDSISIQVILNKTTQNPFVHSAAYFDSENILRAQSTVEKNPISAPAIFSRQVQVQGNLLGRVEVTLDKKKIQSTSGDIATDWIFLWFIYSALTTYLCFNFVSNLENRAFKLVDKLPGKNPNESNGFECLEEKLQPLLELSQNNYESYHNFHYCWLITGSLINSEELKDRLNEESLEKLLNRLDSCARATAKLYGGQRVEGDESTLHLCMRSNDCSKQHLLVCLMLTYSLQQLVKQLSSRLSIKIEMTWILLGKKIASTPIFSFHEDMAQLKKSSLDQAAKLKNEMIAIQTSEFTIDELSSIARFNHLEENYFSLKAFPIERQELLNRQIAHLYHACFAAEINFPSARVPQDSSSQCNEI